MSVPSETDPALDPIANAESDARAATLAQNAVAEGRAELFCGLVALALEAPSLGPTTRSRLRAAAEHLADEAPSYELAARLWLHAGRQYAGAGGSRACECFARSFAYVPERSDEAVAELQRVVRERGPGVADDASRWMRGLVRDGVFPRENFQRFEQAIVDARPATEKDLVRAELVQLSDPAEARARLEALLAQGRMPALRAVFGDLWSEPSYDSPDGNRLAMVLGVLEEMLPMGPDRGEVRYVRSVYLSFNEGGEIALRAAIGVFEDLPEDARTHALVEEILDGSEAVPEGGFFERCFENFGVGSADRARVRVLIERFEGRY